MTTKRKQPPAARGEILAPDGSVIGTCWGCGFTPIRESWLHDCPACQRKVCRVCAEEAQCICRTQQGAA